MDAVQELVDSREVAGWASVRYVHDGVGIQEAVVDGDPKYHKVLVYQNLDVPTEVVCRLDLA